MKTETGMCYVAGMSFQLPSVDLCICNDTITISLFAITTTFFITFKTVVVVHTYCRRWELKKNKNIGIGCNKKLTKKILGFCKIIQYQCSRLSKHTINQAKEERRKKSQVLGVSTSNTKQNIIWPLRLHLCVRPSNASYSPSGSLCTRGGSLVTLTVGECFSRGQMNDKRVVADF